MVQTNTGLFKYIKHSILKKTNRYDNHQSTNIKHGSELLTFAFHGEPAPPAISTLRGSTSAGRSEVLGALVVNLLAAAEAPLARIFLRELGVRVRRRSSTALLCGRACWVGEEKHI